MLDISFQALHSLLFAVYNYEPNWLSTQTKCLTSRSDQSGKMFDGQTEQINENVSQTGPIKQNVWQPDGTNQTKCLVPRRDQPNEMSGTQTGRSKRNV